MIINQIKLFINLFRPYEYLPSIISVLLIPPLVFKRIDVNFLYLFLFTTFITSFGFLINDISDVELDRLSSKSRNPIVRSQISKKQAIVISLVILSMAFYFLSFLSKIHLILGSIILLIYFLYSSSYVRLKTKPPFDILVQSVASLGFIMCYILYQPFDLNAFVTTMAIFALFVNFQLSQEIRDFKSDRLKIKTSVVVLGLNTAIRLMILLLLFFIFCMLYLVYLGFLPFSIILLAPLSYFLFAPMLMALKDNQIREKLYIIYPIRMLIIGILWLILLAIT